MSARAKLARQAKGNPVKPAKLSRTSKPPEMTLEQWQIELRKQFGRAQPFRLKNLGEHPVYSEFQVNNPQSKNSYRVRIRGRGLGDNACSCPDFATNTLGTCKHIEFTLARLERRGETAKLLRQGFLPEFSEIYLQYGARREVRFRPGGECTAGLSRLAANYFDDEGTLRREALPNLGPFLEKAVELEPDLRVGADVLAFLAEINDKEERRQRIDETFRRGVRSAEFKGLVKIPLYEYQREGALFAAKAGRCLIADEMGLGKTIQAITAAEIMAMRLGVERVLIVCPTSLKHQWKREIEKFTDRSAEVIGGSRALRAGGFAAVGNFFKITNYDTVYADLDLIEAWRPDLVILDEAQRIKNWSTRVARSVKKINSAYAIVLTGTPIENRLEELISIVQFVDRYRLGPTFRLLNEHQKVDEVGKVVGYQNLDRIGQTLEPILIRRQKEEVLKQLPERIDSTIFVPMTEPQKKLHRENMELVAAIVQKWRRYKFLTESDRRKLIAGLQNMRMSCDSTYLLDPRNDFGVKSSEAVTLLGEILERPGVKAVIFSQWLRMHELLTQRFKKKGWDHVLFHGGVPSGRRKDLVDRFRDDPKCRLFLATDAGGVGLNLQFASVVMNIDLPWNPAVLEQRIGRVHRLGQEQPVRVVNFVAQGAIEEGMLGVLKFKKALFAGVLDDGAPNVDFGGSRLKKFMETVESVTAQTPQPAPTGEAEGAVNEFRGGSGQRPRASDETADEGQERAPADPWSGLLQTGLAYLQRLAAPPKSGSTAKPAPLMQRDEKSGESFLRLPVPDAKTVEQIVSALGTFLESLRR